MLDSTFVFKGHKFDVEKGEASFSYELQRGSEVLSFTERLFLPVSEIGKDVPEEFVKRVLDNLLLALGISYYKLYCPKRIRIDSFVLLEEQAQFWNIAYTKGLGEFFYQNKIDFRDLIHFPFEKRKEPTVPFQSLPRSNRSLLGIGGGKDSIVAGELLKEQKKQFSSFVVNQHPIRDEVLKVLGGQVIVIRRDFDKQLFELNKRDDSYNGHVPVSLHYAFIGLLLALIYDYRYIIVGNEQSANYGNVEYLGEVINHQWSKSFEFEQLFQDYVREFITADIIYFSLLRSLSELGIAKKFVQYPQYFSVFSSCNRNFRITGEPSPKRWCGECAKCAFAFILLAAFLSKSAVIGIFGENLLGKKSLLHVYQELLGVRAIKPFDCVGTPDEVKGAFFLAQKLSNYDGDVVMDFFKEHVLPKIDNIEEIRRKVLSVSKEEAIPENFQFDLNSFA